MTLTKSECARMGSERSREVSAEIKRRNVEKYNGNPCICKKCKSTIPYEKRRNQFCSHSCAQSVNNAGVRRHGNPRRKCLYCGKPVNLGAVGFCSIGHGRLYNAKNKLSNGSKLSTKSIRRYLIDVRGHKCEQCKFETWLNQPIPIDLHHKDGNKLNNALKNLVLLCKNCHGLSENYGIKKNGDERTFINV